MLNRLKIFALIFIINPDSLLAAKQAWTYTWISMEANTTDSSLVDWQIGIERIGRSNYALTGTWSFHIDVTDETMIEYHCYRSATGSNDYVRMPIEVSKTKFRDYVNDVYKKTAMESLKDCSNFPQFEGTYEGPLGKTTYELNKCQISTEKFPAHLPAGFYKVHLFFTDPRVEMFVEFILKIDPVLM